MGRDYKYMVCTRCFTYNHAQFITDTMNGFIKQETNFPVVYVILDDASTDGEPEVITSFLNEHFQKPYRKDETDDYQLICAKHKSNDNCIFVLFLLKYNHYRVKKSKLSYFSEWEKYAKYIAICEGDDYWISSQKLQIQVGFLEKHPNNSGCIHAYRRDDYQEDGFSSIEIHKYNQSTDIIPMKEIICGKRQFCATASWVYRASAVESYPEWAKRAPVGDKPLKLILFAKGAIGYIDEVMSVYRVGVPGSWTIRVFQNRKAKKKMRQGQINIIKDFDKWTGGKYHKYVKRNLMYYRYLCWKTDFIVRPYLFLKSIFRI